MKKQKVVNVNKQFMLDLARTIYDSKTKQFLRLCDGTLQNGPDPTDEERPMHCGLGELYFQMTGHQPHEDGVDEEDVVNLAVELSPLDPNKCREKLVKQVRSALKNVDLPSSVEEQMLDVLDNLDEDELSQNLSAYREVLNDIPTENDDSCGDECSTTDFLKRSRRVATQLREAAKLLPE